MSSYTTQAIRNIALAGHGGAGKTTLAETILHKAGAINTPGELARGSTVCDFDPQEKAHGHSLDTALCTFEYRDRHVNLIDTPGYPDFIGRSIAILPAVETVAVVISARNGIETMTHRMMKTAADYKLCRMIIINKIDDPDVDLHGLLREVRETFGNECLPINLPADGGTKVVDTFFEPADVETDFASVDAAHTAIVDQVVEVDENLMELYLEQGEELSPKQLHDPFEQALREGHLVPVCFVSAETGAGVPELIDVFARLMPNPMEGNPPHFLKGEGAEAEPVTVTPDPDAHVVAHVVKVTVDPFVGRLGIFRVHQGTVTPNSQLFIGDGRKPFKVSHLFELQGKEHHEVPRGIPGDLRAVAKVEEVAYDAVLHDSHDEDHYHVEPVKSPPPMSGLAIQTRKRGDEQKLSEALHKLSAEDPSIRIEHNTTTNETVLRGLGDLHLRALLEKMKDRYHVEVDTHPPSIPYRETITAAAEGHHRHKKQTGGAGQFGEVFLKVEPLPLDGGFEFVNKVVGGVIPSQYIPAVEKGVRQVIDAGAVAGYPLQDVRVTVYDGKHHPVDSKEVAFVAAGKKAFLDAVAKARPKLLEPIVAVQITAPASSMGDITGDLSSRRGRISGNTMRPNNKVRIDGQVPLSELDDYQSRLKSLTGGEGTFTMSFSHYEAVPPQRQAELKAAYKPGPDHD